MGVLLFILTLLGALGAGLVAGIFFAFSTFVMTAMQSINVAVLKPTFFSVFFGTGLVSLALAIIALADRSSPASAYLLASALLYIAGSLLVTIIFNVPLNNQLKAVTPESPEGASLWSAYLTTWTAWNTIRTIASLAASALFIFAIYAS